MKIYVYFISINLHTINNIGIPLRIKKTKNGKLSDNYGDRNAAVSESKDG